MMIMTGRTRINGSLLGNYIGQQVALVGRIKRVSSSGQSVELVTTDNISVAVTLPQPIDGNVDEYVEVHGVVQSRSTVMGKSFFRLPNDIMNDFEPEVYNKFAHVAHILGNKRWHYLGNMFD